MASFRGRVSNRVEVVLSRRRFALPGIICRGIRYSQGFRLTRLKLHRNSFRFGARVIGTADSHNTAGIVGCLNAANTGNAELAGEGGVGQMQLSI